MSDTTTIFEYEQDLDTFGGRLSRARAASGLSTKELAWRLGVKSSTINAWECDRSQPSALRMDMLSGILSISLSWLLHGVGAAPADPDEETAWIPTTMQGLAQSRKDANAVKRKEAITFLRTVSDFDYRTYLPRI